MSSDREILEKLNSGQHLCGRFNAAQLGRELYVPETKSALWLAAASGILGFMVLGGIEAVAQTKGEVVRIDMPVESIVLGKPLAPISRAVTGRVAGENGQAISAVYINIKGTDRHCTSDMDGNFSIDAQPFEILQFRFMGYRNSEFAAHEVRKMPTVTLVEDNILLGEVAYSQPSFFKRLYHRIRNIFH